MVSKALSVSKTTATSYRSPSVSPSRLPSFVFPFLPTHRKAQRNSQWKWDGQAIARLILSGVLDRHPTLKLLLAHSAGALPALSSRLSSCVVHDPTVKEKLQHDFRYYLGMLYYDAVAYGPEELALVERTVARAGNYEGKDERAFLFIRWMGWELVTEEKMGGRPRFC